MVDLTSKARQKGPSNKLRKRDVQENCPRAGRVCRACWTRLRRRRAVGNQDRHALCVIRTLRLDLDAGLQLAEIVGRAEECRWWRLCEGLRQEAADQAHRL